MRARCALGARLLLMLPLLAAWRSPHDASAAASAASAAASAPGADDASAPAARSPPVAVSVGVVERLWPPSGSEAGGTRVTLSGFGLPLFASGVRVAVGAGGRLSCSDVRVERPLRALSCVMPRCVHCGEVAVAVAAAGGAPLAGTQRFRYDSRCYAGARPPLPPRYSGAENCTVCRLAVAGALATLGDETGNAELRTALRRACDSPHIKSVGRVGEAFCRSDMLGACLALYHADAMPLAEAIWAEWPAAYERGALPEAACRAIGRCPTAAWLRAHSHEDAWAGG